MNLARFAVTALFTLLLATSLVPGSSQAQQNADTTSFKYGLQLYEKNKYTQAARVFSRLTTPESRLFAGKSYYSAGAYLKSQKYLDRISSEAPSAIRFETKYTRALLAFQLKHYERALGLLHEIKTAKQAGTSLRNSAGQFYKQLLEFLTIDQRKKAFLTHSDKKIRLDLLTSLIGRIDYASLKNFVQDFKPFLPDSLQAGIKRNELRTALADSLVYEQRRQATEYGVEAPDGMHYDVGVVLPRFNRGEAEFEVTRSLYNGILLATEEFNKQYADRKVFIRYRSSRKRGESIASIFNRLVWNQPLDAVIGPLYSGSADKMADLAERYQVTMVTPLANSDTLNLDNPYVFQVNPTFSVRGKAMARFAVNELGIDTVAVIAQQNALGYESAFAFREQAERLGAEVPYFFVENFEATAYDLSDYTKYFTADKQLRDSLGIQNIEAIYAPFTGRAAPSLIDLLMTDLEAAGKQIPVFGSAEWGTVEMKEKRIKNYNMYYPETDPLMKDTRRFQQFVKQYKERYGLEPTRFSFIGYDTAYMLLKALYKAGNPAYLNTILKRMPLYKGLSGPIQFRGEHINQRIKIKKIKLK